MKNFILLVVFTFLCAFSANAQVAKMSSVYTNLKVDCKPESKVVADEVPFICKAVGGFRILINPAGAWAETIDVVDAQKETVATLGTHGYGYSTAPKRAVEWRMANGKPFAVIFRVNTYNADKAMEDGDSPYLEKYKTGEKLIVRGLTGYSQIDFEVDAKEKNANVKAQKLADENFQ